MKLSRNCDNTHPHFFREHFLFFFLAIRPGKDESFTLFHNLAAPLNHFLLMCNPKYFWPDRGNFVTIWVVMHNQSCFLSDMIQAVYSYPSGLPKDPDAVVASSAQYDEEVVWGSASPPPACGAVVQEKKVTEPYEWTGATRVWSWKNKIPGIFTAVSQSLNSSQHHNGTNKLSRFLTKFLVCVFLLTVRFGCGT